MITSVLLNYHHKSMKVSLQTILKCCYKPYKQNIYYTPQCRNLVSIFGGPTYYTPIPNQFRDCSEVPRPTNVFWPILFYLLLVKIKC